MELEVLAARGVPPTGLLSISAGGTRKQVQMSAINGPLRFPPTEDVSQVKVDVLGVLGRGRVMYHPASEKYTLPLEASQLNMGADGINMEVDIAMRPCDPQMAVNLTQDEDEATRQRKEVDANGYLEQHDLVSFMQFLLNSLMQDRPADPYPFLQKQLAMRVAAKAGMASIAPENLAAVAALSSSPLSAIPSVQDSDQDVSGLLERVSPMNASSGSAQDVAQIEREAEDAKNRLLQDNVKLRETAMQMNLEYEQLMRESASLHERLQSKRTAKSESRTLEAYREIEKLQDEVSQLAKENAKLVTDLARGREMIDLVRKDMLDIQRSIGE